VVSSSRHCTHASPSHSGASGSSAAQAPSGSGVAEHATQLPMLQWGVGAAHSSSVVHSGAVLEDSAAVVSGAVAVVVLEPLEPAVLLSAVTSAVVPVVQSAPAHVVPQASPSHAGASSGPPQATRTAIGPHASRGRRAFITATSAP
jgi:hypothetical protein